MTEPSIEERIEHHLFRINNHLRRLADHFAPITPSLPDTPGYVWQPDRGNLAPVAQIVAPPLCLLQGIDAQRDRLKRNTESFARTGVANHALLWGARGTGKSTLVRTCVASIQNENPSSHLRLVEMPPVSLQTLPALLDHLKWLSQPQETQPSRRIIIFLDDLSFSTGDEGYRSLKSLLEGSLTSADHQILVYATSNRRHLIDRESIEQENGNALHPQEIVEEKVSLSDRFGLSIGFSSMSQECYLSAVAGYLGDYGQAQVPDWQNLALRWSRERGGRSGRVSTQFVRHCVTSFSLTPQKLPLIQAMVAKTWRVER